MIRKIFRFIYKIIRAIITSIENLILASFYKQIPPTRFRLRVSSFYSVRDYLRAGQTFFEILIKFYPSGGASKKILDIGCGCGQVARLLTNYVGQDGQYEGFDIDNDMISWCREHITSKYQNFNFKHVDVFNKSYPHVVGRCSASEFEFPYKDNYFDFVFAKSVFTHLLSKDADNYLAQISKVLKKGGKAILTFFLLSEKTKFENHLGKGGLHFNYSFESCFSINKDIPEAAVAYDESFILELLDKYGLLLAKPVQYGSWRETISTHANYQDILFLIKR